MRKQNQRGFTLMELMVAVSIFVIVTAMGFSMYMAVNRVQRNNLSSNVIYAESRYWLDLITEEIQSNSVFYDNTLPYPNPTMVPEDELQITNAQGERVRYYLEDSNLDGYTDTLMRQVGSSLGEQLTSPEIKVTRFDVYIDPVVKSDTDVAKVTIVWQAASTRAGTTVVVNLQTTAAVRRY